jgi:hypothetical protein
MRTLTTTRRISFPLGQIVATPGALQTLLHAGFDAARLLARHERGDWGDVDAHDRAANNAALADGARLFSAYALGDTGERIWIITEADRSATTILRPDEY